MDVTTGTLKERVEGLERTLTYIRRMYTNPELRNVIDLTLVGRYTDAVNYGKRYLLRNDGIDYMGEGLEDPE